MIAMQALAGAGDEVVAVVPVWPNLTAQPAILGAQVTRVSLHPRGGAWMLDLDELLGAVTPRTRVLLVNAPNNPTGWALTRDEQQAILEHCRRTGTWIVADEVYERIHFASAQAVAPSFIDIADADDRLVVVHSFSKSFLMTGWRLGWMVVPCGADRCRRQADRVQHLVRAGVRAARRARSACRRRGFRASARETPAPLPRHSRAVARRAARGAGGAAARRDVRLLSRRRRRRLAGIREAPGRRCRARAWLRAPRSAVRARAGCAGASRLAIPSGCVLASSV